MSWFSNARIGTRINFALLIPMIAMLAFSAMLLMDRWSASDNMQRVSHLAELGPKVSGLVHELQKERGTSAVYIGSKAKKFSAELPVQWKDTDGAYSAFKVALADFETQNFGGKMPARIKAARAALANLKGMRDQVKGLGATVPKMAGYYTPTIRDLLAIVEEMSALSTDAQVTSQIVSYTNFLQGKERAGLERAMGGAGFGAGTFAKGVYLKFVSLIAQQQDLFGVFAKTASPELVGIYKKTMVGAAVDDVARMRKIALDGGLTGDVQGTEGGYWFATITKKINLMKSVEDRIATDLLENSLTRADSASQQFYLLLVITIAVFIGVFVVGTIVVRGITGPISGMTNSMKDLADGDSTVVILGTDRGDEIGHMATAVLVFKENMIKNAEMAEEEKWAGQLREARQRAVLRLMGGFKDNVRNMLTRVSAASDSMEGTSHDMSTVAEETTARSNDVERASNEASNNVQTVASAAEELSSSISEISRQVTTSTRISGEAVNQVEGANEKVRGLAEAAKKIGEVVAMITDIADQTNLLALNATIEAARAGEAGKGFAVVASEVKNLANQTARATEEISAQIGGIQGATEEAVEAIGSIGGTISEINEIASAIAAAVEEQGAATQEIARNVEQAAGGTRNVSENIHAVSESASRSAVAAKDVDVVAVELKGLSDDLGEQIEKFLSSV